jgi:predicted HAD superfamily phosphohydrolase YqeG
MLRKLTDCLRPDWICPSAAAVDFAGLAAAGKRLVLLDIDNTLAPHGARLPGPYARQIVDAIRQAGLIPFIISNAKPARAQTFAAALQAEAIGLAGKPSPRALIRACRQNADQPRSGCNDW